MSKPKSFGTTKQCCAIKNCGCAQMTEILKVLPGEDKIYLDRKLDGVIKAMNNPVVIDLTGDESGRKTPALVTPPKLKRQKTWSPDPLVRAEATLDKVRKLKRQENKAKILNFRNRHDHKLREMIDWHPDAVDSYVQQYEGIMSDDDLWVIDHLFPTYKEHEKHMAVIAMDIQMEDLCEDCQKVMGMEDEASEYSGLEEEMPDETQQI